MPREKESAPGLEVGRASVSKDERIIPQSDWERMCRGLPWLFALAGSLWLIWEAVAWS